jgi:serine/threonine protein kinase
MFLSEARLVAALKHPSIVEIYDVIKDGGQVYLVFELVCGRTLGLLLRERGALPLAEALNILRPVAEAVDYAHSQKIIHRDLNPGNIMLGDFGEVWILDWGLARDLAEGKDSVFSIENSYDKLFNANYQPSDNPDDKGAETLMLPTTDASRHPASNGRHEHIVSQLTNRVSKGSDKFARTAPKNMTRLSWKPQTGTIRKAAHPDSTTIVKAGVEKDTTGLFTPQESAAAAYLSPEQARNEVVDERSDLYSVAVILFELLTLETPDRVEENESTSAFLKRERKVERRTLTDLWPEAPAALSAICEKALAGERAQRYQTCAELSRDLRVLLDELSKSYSELEMQRLAHERLGEWNTIASRDFSSGDDLSPCNEPPTSRRSEAVGQVLHPEFGGMLIGGWGLQIYPVSLQVGDDMRMTLELSVLHGSEIWLFMRGIPPAACYVYKIGAYGGRWLAICKAAGEDDLIDCEIVTLRPLRMNDTTTVVDPNSKVSLEDCKIAIEIVGTRISLTYNDQEPLVAQDPCPVSGPLNRQLAIGTWESHALVRRVEVQQRRSPLMLPSFAIGSELLRQKLYPQAVDTYRRFLAEHPDNEYAVEAKFMLCLAFIQMKRSGEAERQLRDFLSQHVDHPFAQDAMYELARIILDQSGDFQRAVRAVLSYQDAGDFVRSRFCLLLLNAMFLTVRREGPTENTFNVLSMIRTLMRGSPDEGAILATLSVMLGRATRFYLHRILDEEAQEEVDRVRDLVASVHAIGYSFPGSDRRTPFEYLALAHRLMVTNDPDETRAVLNLGQSDPDKMVYFIHDALHLIAVGAHAQILAALDGANLRPLEHVIKAGLLARAGRMDEVTVELDHCYHYVDVIETERSDLSLRFAARIGAYGLGLLPWNLLWQSMTQDPMDRYLAPLEVLAGWFAECMGHQEDAVDAYRFGAAVGTGFRGLCIQALKRHGHPTNMV